MMYIAPVYITSSILTVRRRRNEGLTLQRECPSVLFISPALKVYGGQIVGENSRDADMVVQVCRKGLTQDEAGPDFTLNDLQNLELASKILAKLPFMHVAH